MDAENGGSSAGEQNSGNICRDFLRKVCTRGRNCKYVHPANAETKLEFCHDFQNSICRRRNCKFIHCTPEEKEHYMENGVLPSSVDEVGNRGGNARGPPSQQDAGFCRDFMNGKCTRGARCKFRHQSEGDAEYERMRSMRGSRGRGGGFGAFSGDDDFGFGAEPPRRPAAMDAYRAISRYGRPGGYDRSSFLDLEKGRPGLQSSSDELLEEENTRLRQKVELLRKQVDDLTSTNEYLLKQNAGLRTGQYI